MDERFELEFEELFELVLELEFEELFELEFELVFELVLELEFEELFELEFPATRVGATFSVAAGIFASVTSACVTGAAA